MTKKQTLTSQNKEIILDIAKTQSPQTTQELIKLAQPKTGLTEQEISNLIIQLENEDKLKFTKKQTPPAKNAKDYASSKNASWFWITIALAVATAIAVFTIPEEAYPIVYVRQALGIVFVLFLPGYAFIRLLFPKNLPFATTSQEMDSIERFALSIGLSLALVPMVGLVLNYTPWGIMLTPITLSLLALTTLFAVAAVFREHQTQNNFAQQENIIHGQKPNQTETI